MRQFMSTTSATLKEVTSENKQEPSVGQEKIIAAKADV